MEEEGGVVFAVVGDEADEAVRGARGPGAVHAGVEGVRGPQLRAQRAVHRRHVLRRRSFGIPDHAD